MFTLLTKIPNRNSPLKRRKNHHKYLSQCTSFFPSYSYQNLKKQNHKSSLFSSLLLSFHSLIILWSLAMTQTMSGPNDWLQFYNQNLTSSTPDFTVAATTATGMADTSPPVDMPISSSPSGSTHLSPEGRVGKPTRRRSRASRRTPTTLLNTDTTNFRAMVQQFTGGPSAPFASSSAPQVNNLPNLMGFGFQASRPNIPSLSPTTLVMPSPPITYLQQQHMLQQQNQQYNLYSTGGGGDNSSSNNTNNNNMFFQRLSNNNVNPMSPPPTSNVVVNNRDGGAVNMDHGRFFPNTSSS